MDWKNPFRLVDTPDGPAYDAAMPDGPGIAEFERDEIQTLIAIQHFDGPADVMLDEPGHLDGVPVAILPGLWEPSVGTPIQVAEPNRDVVVSGIRYQVDGGGFAAIV